MKARNDQCPECGRRKPIQWAVCLLCPMDKHAEEQRKQREGK